MAGTPFEKGHKKGGAPLGNKNAARAKGWRNAIMAEVTKHGGSLEEGLAMAAKKLVELAMNGERWAMEELGNRIDGKPAQVIIGDDDEAPVRLVTRIELVSLEKKSAVSADSPTGETETGIPGPG